MEVIDMIASVADAMVVIEECDAEIERLKTKIAELEGKVKVTSASALELFKTQFCGAHQEDVASLTFDAFVTKENTIGCAWCLADRLERVTDALCDVVNQECTQPDGTLNSFCISSSADSMRLLSDLGLLVIDKEHGRNVIGHWRIEGCEE
jgi:hypothetical protein